MSVKSPKNYIDNRTFLRHMTTHWHACQKARQTGQDLPVLSEYVGECILKICQNLALKSNFYSYTYREEMVSDAIDNCITYANNFNPEKSDNPFGYFTQIAHFAFIRRIAREKKQSYIKFRLLEHQHINGSLFDTPEDGPALNTSPNPILSYDNVKEFIHAYEVAQSEKRLKQTTATRSTKHRRKKPQ